MTLYTTAQLWELGEKVEEKVDEILVQLTDPDISSEDVGRCRHRLGRLSDAAAWLSMMQVCVKSDAAVVDLEQGVAVTLGDYEIL